MSADPSEDPPGESPGAEAAPSGPERRLRDRLAGLRGRMARAQQRAPLRRARFATDAGVELADVYTALDAPQAALSERNLDEIGLPGEYPFTRGVQPTMYRGRLWTM